MRFLGSICKAMKKFRCAKRQRLDWMNCVKPFSSVTKISNSRKMKKLIPGLMMLITITQMSFAQSSDLEQQIINLSKDKWQWMADKNVEKLAPLFHANAKFVHMGGTYTKERELEIIESGSIWYKNADVKDVAVEFFDDTVILWNRITLVAEVRGNEVTNEFTVTEIYKKYEDGWKLLGLTFSSVRDTHTIEH
jgi:hypothetical protein